MTRETAIFNRCSNPIRRTMHIDYYFMYLAQTSPGNKAFQERLFQSYLDLASITYIQFQLWTDSVLKNSK